MSDRIFVNTNILVYAHDADAGQKHTAAAYSKNAAVILTEDMNHGQTIEGIRIQNPFIKESTKRSR